MAYIKQTSIADELAKPELRIEYIVRYRRLRWLGEIMRMQDHRVLHTEVRKYADMILQGLVQKRGSLLHDAPAYCGTVHLQEHAGWLPQDVVEEKWVPGEANAVGQQWSLRAIQAQVKQRQRWDSKVVELKEQIWTGADAVEEATDIATAVD